VKDIIEFFGSLLPILKETSGYARGRAIIVILPISIIFFVGLFVYAIIDRVRTTLKSHRIKENAKTYHE
jgi:threonine/homoserine/homoserine lactone efflux protein